MSTSVLTLLAPASAPPRRRSWGFRRWLASNRTRAVLSRSSLPDPVGPSWPFSTWFVPSVSATRTWLCSVWRSQRKSRR